MTTELDPVLHVQVTPGIIEYLDNKGAPQKFYFQCNPGSLSRSRTVTRTDSAASNQAVGTKTARGEAGIRYTITVSAWKIDSFELWFDASMPHWTNGVRSEGGGLAAVVRGIEHLEELVEPGPVRHTEVESQLGLPPLPGPPLVTLRVGTRAWLGHVNSVSILEKDFTPDLVPKQVKATLSIEVIMTESQLQQGKRGGKR